MSEKKYDGKEALAKMKKIVKDLKVGMMATQLGQKPLSIIPMQTQKTGDDGKLYFLSGKSSDHNKDIEQDKDVHMVYSCPKEMEFLSIYGTAEISTDRTLLDDLYDEVTDNWFDGVGDPELTAIVFEPQKAYYWDTKSNKYVTLFKMGLGALTDNKQDIGEKGKLDL